MVTHPPTMIQPAIPAFAHCFGRGRFGVSAANRRGTNLLELIVVVGIIAILAVTAVGYYGDVRSQAEVAVASENLRLFREALARHFKQNLTYPTSVASFTFQNFSGKTPRSMFLEPFQSASVTLFVEIPDAAAGASPNAWQATTTVLVPWTSSSGSPGSQFRNVKLKIDQTFMNW